jgi:hypothetical protein
MDILTSVLGSSKGTPVPAIKNSKAKDNLSDPRKFKKGMSAEERNFLKDMPENIDFEGVGDLDIMEDDFCRGVEDIENQFQKLVKKAENDFDVKHS